MQKVPPPSDDLAKCRERFADLFDRYWLGGPAPAEPRVASRPDSMETTAPDDQAEAPNAL